MAAQPVAAGPPVLPQLLMNLLGVISAVPATAGAPGFGTASFGQKHVVVALVPALNPPILGTTALGKVLAAAGVSAGTPAIGPALLGRVLAATPLAAGAPSLGQPALALNAAGLAAVSLATSPPTLAAAGFGQRHTLVGLPVAGRVVIGVPFLGQQGVMAAVPLWVGEPALGIPTLVHRIRVTATAVAAGAPALAEAALGQTHKITARALAVRRLDLQEPWVHLLAALLADGFTVGSPELGAPGVKKVRRPPVAPVHLTGGRARPAGPAGRISGPAIITGRLSRSQMAHPEDA